MTRRVTAALTAILLAVTLLDARRIFDDVDRPDDWRLLAAWVGLAALLAAWMWASRDTMVPRRTGLAAAFVAAYAVWGVAAALTSADVSRSLVHASVTLVVAWVALELGRAPEWALVAATLAGAVVGYIAVSIVVELITESRLFDGERSLLALEPSDSTAAGVGVITGLTLLAVSDRRLRALGVLATGIGVAMLISSDSRTSIVAIVLVGFYALARSLDRRKAALVIGSAALALAVGLGTGVLVDLLEGLDDDTTEGIDIGLFLGDRRLGARVELWEASIDSLSDRPVTGFGPGTDWDRFVEQMRAGDPSWPAQHGYSMWMQAAMMGGIVGVVLLLAAVVTSYADPERRPNAARDTLVVFLLVDGVAEPVLRTPSIGFFALAASLAWVGSVAPDRGREGSAVAYVSVP